MRNCITNIAVTKLAETQGLALVFPAVAAVICGGGVSGGKIRADGTVFSCLPVHPARVLKIYNIYYMKCFKNSRFGGKWLKTKMTGRRGEFLAVINENKHGDFLAFIKLHVCIKLS